MNILMRIKKTIGDKNAKLHTGGIRYIVITLLLTAFLMMICGVQNKETNVTKQSPNFIGFIFPFFTYFGVASFFVFFIYMKNANSNYKKLIEAEKKLRIFQQNNYELLLSREEETRAFRHDMSNHIVCLKEIVASENISLANDYLNEMSFAMSQIQEKVFSTGNTIIDAIINYYAHQLEHSTSISVKGNCMVRLHISNMDLSAILSNLMQNAVEALNNQTKGEKFLSIRLECKQGFFKFNILNSIDKELAMSSDGLPITSKVDKKNHGIGLKHVKKLIKNLNGFFQIEISNNVFHATLILPIEIVS